MHKELAKSSMTVFFAFCIVSTVFFSTAKAGSSVTYKIAGIQAQLSGNVLNYMISGNSIPVYTVSERFSPFRVVLDIAGGVFSENFVQSTAQIAKNDFAQLTISEINDRDPAVLRFEFSLADSHDYTITDDGNSLKVKIMPTGEKKSDKSLNTPQGLTLTDFKITTTPRSTTIVIASNSAIKDYTVDTIAGTDNRPPRMFIDIKNVQVNELVREKRLGTSVEKIRVAPRGKGTRIVFDSASAEIFRYTVLPTEEGLSVVIDESANQQKNEQKNAKSDTTLDALIGSSEQLVTQAPGQLSADATLDKNSSPTDDFTFAGYNKQRISVDFYKIDIHNVFRLFRQITDLNIIVDEQVSGSLTLALSDVPWDFALDIILNLMDLKKEERFNTVVIYPKQKAFLWPSRAEDNLSFEADIEVIEQESLVIEQSASQSKEIMQAKDYMVKAQTLMKREEYEDAALLYAKALELWPANIQISNRLTTIYLVHLGMNAKAVFYAKETLKRAPDNRQASLYAAIGSANMQRIAEASEFFAQSINDSPPMKEALISYAAFSENNGHNEAALKLLDKYHSFYSETVITMVAKARILDKLELKEEATEQYKAVLASGFQMRPDLKKFIQARIKVKEM